jgi:hypothetical protein
MHPFPDSSPLLAQALGFWGQVYYRSTIPLREDSSNSSGRFITALVIAQFRL